MTTYRRALEMRRGLGASLAAMGREREQSGTPAEHDEAAPRRPAAEPRPALEIAAAIGNQAFAARSRRTSVRDG